MQAQAADVAHLLGEQVASLGSNSAYVGERQQLLDHEREERWDEPARQRASPAEIHAQQIVFHIREQERADPELYGDLPSEEIPHERTRDMGGRFLANKERIEQSQLFKIAHRMPKGCHLHIHFNTEIPPELLLQRARGDELQRTMCIRTTVPLYNQDKSRKVPESAEIVFNVLPEKHPKGDCFSKDYNPSVKSESTSPWMLWVDFRRRFPQEFDFAPIEPAAGLDNAECWAREKMVVVEGKCDHGKQTLNGAWACFNQGTRAFKGLVNYEGAYRWYIGAAIDSMIEDGVMYAELRPMLMDKSIPSDDGTRKLDNYEQMGIICEEVARKQKELKDAGHLDKFPFGLKIIYCTPRSIPRPRMQTELQDCLQLKLRFPDLICGFDLVGAEDRPNHIGFYADLLVAFANTCDKLGVAIPFMFHAGETLLDTGGSTDPDNSNLYDSLLLKSKRIGHGYALLKHPLLIEKCKRANVCLELCPISNELLHLCRNVREHPYPALLAAGLHCTLNADNPSLFRGATESTKSLSYEFYQVMVGDTRMTVHGWKQLAEWSIEHSCLTDHEIQRGLEIFRRDWNAFCEWIVQEYGPLLKNEQS